MISMMEFMINTKIIYYFAFAMVANKGLEKAEPGPPTPRLKYWPLGRYLSPTCKNEGMKE